MKISTMLFIVGVFILASCTAEELTDFKLLADAPPSNADKLGEAVSSASPGDWLEVSGQVVATTVNPAIGAGMLAFAAWWRKMQEQKKAERLAKSVQPAVDALSEAGKEELVNAHASDPALRKIVARAQGKLNSRLDKIKSIF